MKHSLALLLCSWLVPTRMLGSCGSTRSVELVGGELAEVTSSFLASLDADQQRAAQRAIDHEEVMKWHFVPGRYAGVEMGALDPGQRRGADEVLRTMLVSRRASEVRQLLFSLGLLDPIVLFALNYLFQAINTFFLPASCQSLRGFSKTGISRFSSGDRSESPPPLRGLSSRLDPHICQT